MSLVPRPSPRPRVLVIDDDPALLGLFDAVLSEECDYVVSAHPDHPPTAAEIQHLAPDLVVIDHHLAHGVQGWQLVQDMRALADCVLHRRQQTTRKDRRPHGDAGRHAAGQALFS